MTAKLSEERALVIENIRTAIADGDSFRKVSVGDPKPTREDIERVIVPFDNLRCGAVSRVKATVAGMLADSMTAKVNAETSITGLEHALSIDGGAIITSNHYNPTDSTPIRMMANLCKRRGELHIIVQQSNIFMTGLFGFLMKNCNTHPVSSNLRYMAKNLAPALKEILARGSFVLIYPEQEMWFNYKKPRQLRDGAYHYASLFGVPILPTFTEMTTLDGERDRDGLLPVKHTLHIMPPIYPDTSLPLTEDRTRMQALDLECKRLAYERAYGIPLTADFVPERDIAGLRKD